MYIYVGFKKHFHKKYAIVQLKPQQASACKSQNTEIQLIFR